MVTSPDGDGGGVSPSSFASDSGRPRLLFASQKDVDDLATLLSETASDFTAPSNLWKVHANAAKFERLLDEKYGRFRPIVDSHPQIEVVFRNLQRKYAMGGFSPLRSNDSMPVSKTTAVIALFMMHRNGVRFDAIVLAATFCLLGLQPWALVTLVALGRWEVERRKGQRVRGMPRVLRACEPYHARGDAKDGGGGGPSGDEGDGRARKYAILARPVGAKYNPADLSLRDEAHDVVLLGSGVETLYAGALLARAGRRVCVLSPTEDASECVVIPQRQQRQQQPKTDDRGGGHSFDGVPFDVRAANLTHPSRQQRLLAPALCTSTDAQGGIRFARVGSRSDGYAHSVLSVPGLGADGGGAAAPVVVNAGGPAALAEHCATCLGDGFPGGGAGPDGGDGEDDVGNSTSLGYLRACRQIDAGSGEHHLSKLFAKDHGASSQGNAYRQSAARPASAFLDKCLPLSPHVRSLMAALGMAGENLSPRRASMAAHVSHLCAMTSEEGMSYPVGGPRALCHALASAIEQCGGRVVGGASPQELLFEELPEEETPRKEKRGDGDKGDKGEKGEKGGGPRPRCRGVRLADGCEVAVPPGGAVLSTLGLLPTFLQLLPPSVRAAHGVPNGLPALSERRPLLKLLVGVRGTREELDLTGADWYRLPNAAVPRDGVSEAGEVEFGNIGDDDDDGKEDGAGGPGEGDATTAAETLEIAAAAGQGGGRGKRSKAAAAAASTSSAKKAARRPNKFAPGRSWMKVSFPSAKDPSWVDRHGSATTCVVTVEADDDFVRMFDTKPRIYSVPGSTPADVAERLKDRVLKDLVDTFPQLAGEGGGSATARASASWPASHELFLSNATTPQTRSNASSSSVPSAPASSRTRQRWPPAPRRLSRRG